MCSHRNWHITVLDRRLLLDSESVSAVITRFVTLYIGVGSQRDERITVLGRQLLLDTECCDHEVCYRYAVYRRVQPEGQTHNCAGPAIAARH